MTQTVTIPVPPVPSAQTAVTGNGMMTQPFQQWLVNVRDKINQINSVIVAISGAGTPLAAFNSLSPLTTKGDMLTYNAGNNIRLPIGTNGQILSVVSGLPAWVNASAGSSPLTTKGDLYGYNTTNARIPVGTDGQVLTADSTAGTGVSWKTSGTSSYDSTVLADSPIGYWKFSDVSGTVVVDSSTNANNGVYAGTIAYLGINGPANLNGAVVLNGTNAYITIAPIAAYLITTWSIEIWFNLTAPPGSIRANFLTEKYTGGTNPVGYAVGLNLDATIPGQLMMGFYTGSAWVRVVGFAPALNTLYQVVGTYDGSTLRMYINGTLYASAAAAGLITSNDGLIIGADNQAVGNYLPSLISSASLYNIALTPARVKAHYLAGR